jgi:hypothetical protein
MGTKSKCEIHLYFICSLWMYRFYLGYKNKLCIEFNYNLKQSIEFIYKDLHLYSIMFMSARKGFGFWRSSDFGFSCKRYSICTSILPYAFMLCVMTPFFTL